MNWLDYVLIALGVGFAINGAIKGFTRQIVGLAAMVFGLLLACWFYGTAGAFLIPYVSHKGIANFIGFLLVFVGVQAAGSLTGWLISKFFKTIGLSWMDRLLGVAFGLLKGALTAIVLVVGLTSFAIKPLPDAVAGSRIAPVLVEAGRVLVALTPKEMRDGFERTYQNLKRYWEEQVRPKIDNKVKDRGALPAASA